MPQAVTMIRFFVAVVLIFHTATCDLCRAATATTEDGITCASTEPSAVSDTLTSARASVRTKALPEWSPTARCFVKDGVEYCQPSVLGVCCVSAGSTSLAHYLNAYQSLSFGIRKEHNFFRFRSKSQFDKAVVSVSLPEDPYAFHTNPAPLVHM